MAELHTIHWQVRGTVQGVGFRPFIYRIARQVGLSGWVRNDRQGVTIEAIGSADQLQRFEYLLHTETPPAARIAEASVLDEQVGGERGEFKIVSSDSLGLAQAALPADFALCADCARELFDPNDRRYRYPFINCIHCGPRYSIIESLPYDREHTTMKGFRMCEDCQREYEDPENRRFHAQANACPVCGPQLELWNEKGEVLAQREQVFVGLSEAIIAGQIVALKGLGGFQLLVDARNEQAVLRLRERKNREFKPLALMLPDLSSVEKLCLLSDIEREILLSAESPILLARQRPEAAELISAAVAPGNPNLGVMLPYTPLHRLLLTELPIPLVATSGNRSEEPICIEEKEALQRLQGIADIFLIHNRPICRHVDDSVVRVVLGRELVLRRARGFAPQPLYLNEATAPTIAVGAHLKNTVAISAADEAIVSQHIGDLETAEAFRAFRTTIQSLSSLYDVKPTRIACDLHPHYLSTQYAEESGLALHYVQHHYAHALSCMAECGFQPPVLAVVWDGTGYGPDGSIWGGEFLLIGEEGFERVAHLHPFRLPGGDRAILEPRRTALAVLYEIMEEEAFSTQSPVFGKFSPYELDTLRRVLKRKINCPLTSSAGRLFDAVSSLFGLVDFSRYEGHAAMEMEFAMQEVEQGKKEDIDFRVEIEQKAHSAESCFIVDWRPLVQALLLAQSKGMAVRELSLNFHNALAKAILLVAERLNIPQLVLSGGCFQNKYLTEQTVIGLEEAGFEVGWHSLIPPNDNGISLGQLIAVIREEKEVKRLQGLEG